MSVAPASVVVVGSLNLDYIASVDRLPVPGQTIAATELIRRFGGKGANQAIAAARQGAKVSMVGCVGADDDGSAYIDRLKAESINVAGVSRSDKALTGTALIAVDRKAENMIIVAAGANGHLSPRAIEANQTLIRKAGALLLQFEIPMNTAFAAIRCANHAGVRVILNPSPLQPGFPWGRYELDTVIVNAGEANDVFGLKLVDSIANRRTWSGALFKFKIRQVVVTRGAESTLCFTRSERIEVATMRVKPLDTVGAGDAFAGTFTANCARGLDLRAAIQLANCAGALTTLRPGAQEAIPNRAATERAARALR